MKKKYYLILFIVAIVSISLHVVGQTGEQPSVSQSDALSNPMNAINKAKEVQKQAEEKRKYLEENLKKMEAGEPSFKTMDDFSSEGTSEEETGVVTPISSEDTAVEQITDDKSQEIKSTVPDFTEDKSLVKTQFKSLFTSNEAIERLLGGKPRFIYDAQNKPDPMLIPWIKAEEEAKSLLEKASIEIGKGNKAAARDIYKSIIDRFPDTTWAQNAQKMIQTIEQTEIGVVKEQKPVLPPEIARSLTGILWDEKKPLVVIGDAILGKGDTVPNTDVVIKDIKRQSVIFNVRGQDFPVELVGQ